MRLAVMRRHEDPQPLSSLTDQAVANVRERLAVWTIFTPEQQEKQIEAYAEQIVLAVRALSRTPASLLHFRSEEKRETSPAPRDVEASGTFLCLYCNEETDRMDDNPYCSSACAIDAGFNS